MPIIPRNESIQGNIPTAKAVVPGIEAFPGYNNAKIAGEVEKVGTSVYTAALRRKAIKDYLLDESLKTELAVRLDSAMQETEAAPPQVKEGVDLTRTTELDPESGEGGLGFATTTVVPKSQTLVPDYLKRQEQIVAEMRAKGGGKNFDIAAERLTRTATIKMQQRAGAIDEQENVGMVLEQSHTLARRLGTIRPASPGADEAGVTVYRPEADRSYAVTRAGIERRFDDAVAVGAMKADVASKAKITALAKLDHGRAVQTMSADPEKWLAASHAGTNGWNERLTPEAMEKLDAKAEAVLKRREGSANQQRLEKEREVEAGFFERTRPGAAEPLTLDDITKAVSVDRTISREKGEHWTTVVKNLAVGGWDDVPEVRINMALEAGSFKVQRSFLDRVDVEVRNKRLSLKTGEELKDKARTIIQKRDDVAQQEAYHDFSATNTVLNTMLTTSPLLGAKMDQESQTIRANAQDALLQNAKQNGWGTSYAWWQKNSERFTRQLSDRVDAQVEVYNSALPVPLKKDPKTQQILPESIQDATNEAFKRYKIDPAQAEALQKAGRLPAGLLNELKTLDELEKWTTFQAEYRAKRNPPKGSTGG